MRVNLFEKLDDPHKEARYSKQKNGMRKLKLIPGPSRKVAIISQSNFKVHKTLLRKIFFMWLKKQVTTFLDDLTKAKKAVAKICRKTCVKVCEELRYKLISRRTRD